MAGRGVRVKVGLVDFRDHCGLLLSKGISDSHLVFFLSSVRSLLLVRPCIGLRERIIRVLGILRNLHARRATEKGCLHFLGHEGFQLILMLLVTVGHFIFELFPRPLLLFPFTSLLLL